MDPRQLKTDASLNASPDTNESQNTFNAQDLPISSSMHQRYGRLARIFFSRLFGPLIYPTECADRVRSLSQQGIVVYVARARTSLLAVYFNYALSQLGLPLPGFVAGLNLWLWQPVGRLWRLFFDRAQFLLTPWRAQFKGRPKRAEELLAASVLARIPAFVFLKPVARHRKRRPRNDFFRALLTAQRLLDKPIFLIPHTLADRGVAGEATGGLSSAFLGDKRNPGAFREVAKFVSTRKTATVRVAEAINLQEVINAHPDSDDEKLARHVALEIDKRIETEERVIAGPQLPPFESVLRHVLRNPKLKEVIKSESLVQQKSEAALEKKASQYLREIAARFKVPFIQGLSVLLSVVFNRIYDGVVIDRKGLKRILQASRKGQIVFCPAHRSHVDYLVLSYVLWNEGVVPPHIAAGANLSFFPLGTIFRGSGAFFLRRAFRTNKVYGAVFRSYIHELIHQGTSIEFFIEGTRSRTGKLLMPRYGLLSMVVDAWRRGAREDVYFAPVSIDYERIIEAGSYEKELSGAEKKQEDIGGLLKSTGVLRSRYGRVHVQFGKPLSLREFAENAGLPRESGEESDQQWKIYVEKLAFQILYGVAKIGTVTPTSVVATALLGYQGRGLAESTLLAHCSDILDFLDLATGRLSNALEDSEGRNTILLGAVHKLIDDGIVVVDRPGRSDAEPIYRVPSNRRMILDYHKNAVMNLFAPVALIARSLVKAGCESIDYDTVKKDSRFLSRLLRREFIYRADSNFDTHFDDALAVMAIRGFIDVPGDGTIHVLDPKLIRILSGLMDSFVQAYWIVARTAHELREFPLWEREVVTRAQEHARRAFLEGTISRPESANRTLVQNATQWLVLEKIVQEKQDGKRKNLSLSETSTKEELDRVLNDIRAFF